MDRNVFSFGEGQAEAFDVAADARARKQLLGGKGAGLAEMTAAGLPVPPGFTVATGVCAIWQRDGRLPDAIEAEFDRALAHLERTLGKRLGDPDDPLLVSVRSGAPVSMPGMMDTILNLGLNDETVEGLVERTGSARFAYDAYRRFVSMFANVVLGVPNAAFSQALASARAACGAQADDAIDAETLRHEVLPSFFALVERHAGAPFPQDPREQLLLAREAIFRSWMNPRAIEYRRAFGIADDVGTAVNVQAMVFGNKGATSATGVGFTRDPGTGATTFYGEFLLDAQGEDVVAGTRTPLPIAEMAQHLPGAYAELRSIAERLEAHYRWPQDFEFTVEEGRLFMLQTRDAKCTARAALRWAVDLLDQGILDEEEAILRVDPAALDQLLHPVFEGPALAKAERVCEGLPAGPGAASGQAVFTAAAAVARAARGEDVILVRSETCPDDIAGMIAAKGVLTATGGMTSHAAVVGRQLGKPCVVGASALSIDEAKKVARIGGRMLREGDPVSIDGATGAVYLQAIPTMPSDAARWVEGRIQPESSDVLRDWLRLLEIADRHRKLGVLANADQPRDARIARRLGAAGIGLCRTEHMFFEDERMGIVQRMILAAPAGRAGIVRRDAIRARIEAARAQGRRVDPALRQELRAVEEEHGEAIAHYEGALAELLPLQRNDFHGLFAEMQGRPVTIRTLDPPLHEFLPRREELLVAREALRLGKKPENWKRLWQTLDALRPIFGSKRKSRLEMVEAVLRRVDELHEFNPMLGHRGCRLGITYPEITAMQARAIYEAAARCLRRGTPVLPQIMIPLVGTPQELAAQRAIVEQVHAQVQARKKVEIPLQVGTMIEVPRGAIVADEVAAHADFFSLGTNDLTQMTWGYSRDDVGRFLPGYLAANVIDCDPFVRLDDRAVGRLVDLAVQGGRQTRPDLEIGICGEHGGDPHSIAFCHGAGLNYVSCSPWRLPVARLAAAQAAVRERRAAAAKKPAPRAAAGAKGIGPALSETVPAALHNRAAPGTSANGLAAGDLSEGPW